MDNLIKALLVLVPSITIPIILLIYLLFFPEKIEILASFLWKLLSKIKCFFAFARKKYIKHDLQGRVNEFVKNLSGKIPNLESKKIRIDWIDSNESKKSFFEDNKIVLRLKRDDPKECNFVHGA